MNSQKLKEKNIKVELIKLILISFIILLLFSTSTSPLYKNYYEDDSSIFIVIGKAIKNGFTPYTEIFDHKGPVLFFIQTIGQCIFEGRLGIFILQVIFLSITNFFLFKIANMFCNNKQSIYSVLSAMSIFICFLEEGNLSEELSLPFLSICLYLAIKWLLSYPNYSSKKSILYATIFGICFSIISLIRLNNTAIIVGLIVTIFFILIKEKKYKDLGKYILCFLLGVFIIYLPIILYFYNKSALYEMFYGTFIHNFKYIQNVSSSDFLTKIQYNCLLIILMIIMYKKIYNTNKNLCFTIYATAIITIITLLIGPGFSHYYLITVPLIVVFIAFLFNYTECLEKSLKNFVYLIIIVVNIIYSLTHSLQSIYYIINLENITVQSINELTKEIPDDEKNSVFVYNTNINASVYLYGNILPCYKYAFLQNNLIKTNSNIYYELIDYLNSTNSAKWIISYNLKEKNSNNQIDLIILKKYELVDISITRLDFLNTVEENLCLYKLK